MGAEEIIDAISMYFVVGLAFANLYSIVLALHPGALVHSGNPSEPVSYAIVLYYSFVTQLTVGYGDVAPATNLMRSLSVLQSMFGVLYVAILISRFVGLQASGQRTRKSVEDEVG